MSKEKKVKEATYTEIRNKEPDVEILQEKTQRIKQETAYEERELPETKAIMPVKSFSMPLANVEQIKIASQKYQEFLNALISEKDIVRMKDKKTGEEKLVGKKSAFGKIARFWGISTEIIRSFTEEADCKNDVCVWGYANGRSFPRVKRGDKYLIAKAWAKAILPSGQYATRGAAVSEIERGFAHIPHDLIATAETRAVKRSVEAVIGMGEIMLEEENGNDKTEQKPNQSEESLDMTTTQSNFIASALTKLGYSDDQMAEIEFNLNGIVKILIDCDKKDAGIIINSIKKGKENFEALIIKKS